ncbi:Sel1-like repeat family protein [Skeletonema marinoi]|uniref:Sel1-like repeat family protein n=1 Tax=Skeletonema marinoi TaxID=267567 RepID=A0AAD9DDB0_9STRA|nr:Sel1-like repeat family protein [Skeletonema marinoi]
MACCSQVICDGCDCANKIGEIEQSLQHRCPFCRHPAAKTEGEVKQLRMKRAEANDRHALLPMGYDLHQEEDYGSALAYWKKAAELGNAEAHYVVSNIYWEGKGVEKDIKKAIYHLEKAAIDGHPFARYNLGCIEGNNGRKDRAVKHYIIAASLGHDTSLEDLRECYAEGSVQKEDFAAALRAHQAAVDATKSLERDVAEAFYAENKEEK